MVAPLDFEEARELIAWEPVFRGMRANIRARRKLEHLQQQRLHARWERHWRTRLVRWLRDWAAKIDLPEPEPK